MQRPSQLIAHLNALHETVSTLHYGVGMVLSGYSRVLTVILITGLLFLGFSKFALQSGWSQSLASQTLASVQLLLQPHS